jgi:glycosyltransferase involved in cell wall biosynthesis
MSVGSRRAGSARVGLRRGGQRVTVVICTRDRPDSIERAVAAVLASENVAVDLIVVDQSEGRETKQRLAAIADDRLRYVRGKCDGKPFGLNEALLLARNPIVVITDDDCEPPPGWVADMAQILRASPRVGLVFSNVVPPPSDRRLWYVPTYERSTDPVVRSIRAASSGRGLAAGMALRRDVVVGIGGVDDAIGPGARVRSGDHWNLERRLLRKGWDVYETAQLSVLHHGFRSFADGRGHSRRNGYRMGAVVAKPLRAGHLEAISLAVRRLVINAAAPAVVDILHVRRPRGLGRIVAFCRGFGQGLHTPG